MELTLATRQHAVALARAFAEHEPRRMAAILGREDLPDIAMALAGYLVHALREHGSDPLAWLADLAVLASVAHDEHHTEEPQP